MFSIEQTNPNPAMMPRKKKGHVGLWIALSVLFLVIVAGVYLFATIAWLPPKDLGITYSQKDFNAVMRKIGTHIKVDFGAGESYDNRTILDEKPSVSGTAATGYFSLNNDVKGGSKVTIRDLNYKDYKWKFSNYKRKSFALTPVEVSAFFNYIAPGFWWFKNTQIINEGNVIKTSATVDIKKLKSNLYSDVAGLITFPLPDKANLYTEGQFSITNNKITMVPTVMDIGLISIPIEFRTGANLNSFEDYLTRFFTVLNQDANGNIKKGKDALYIFFAGIKDGQFFFDGNIPMNVEVSPK